MNSPSSTTRLAGDREAGTVCPACQDRIRRGEEIVVCSACASVHHPGCWTSGGCGSYACAPGRRDPGVLATAVLRITSNDLDHTAPLPVYRPVAPSMPLPVTRPPRTNRLAIASFVCALAGIPFFGAVTGLVAILLGSLAVGALRDSRQKGTVLAAVGILLGLVDVVGWIVFLSFFLSRPGPALGLQHLRPDLSALENLPAPIGRAMRANVVIETRPGPLERATGLGSGIILKIAGTEATILTNRHVVDPGFARDPQALPDGGAARTLLDVKLVDETVLPGRITWIAPGSVDLALVRIDGATPAARATLWKIGRRARVGDPVFAIGNPHGLGWTHTRGAISQFRFQQVGGKQIRIIQTETALNPGNSGGGLYDQEGYLMGINTWAPDKREADGLNFAIALDALADLAPPGLDLQAGSEAADKP
ncbi:MAG TPA: trypsin-like peptidase domain-containing protein [Gemmataceae bacterium]|nr:trypsin-like peptidase domain-containing protein [Gemmataceae bacterium]